MMRPLPLVFLSALILVLWAGAASAGQTPRSMDPAPVTDLGNSLLERAQASCPDVLLAMGGYVERPRKYNHPRPPQNRNPWGYQHDNGYHNGYYNGHGYHPHKNGPHKNEPHNNGRPPKGPGHK